MRLSRSISQVPDAADKRSGQFVEIGRRPGKPLLYQIEQAQHMRGDDPGAPGCPYIKLSLAALSMAQEADGMAEFDLTAEITSALKDWSGDIADGLDELWTKKPGAETGYCKRQPGADRRL